MGLKLESVVEFMVGCDFVGCCWVLGGVVVAWRLWVVGHIGCGFCGSVDVGLWVFSRFGKW